MIIDDWAMFALFVMAFGATDAVTFFHRARAWYLAQPRRVRE